MNTVFAAVIFPSNLIYFDEFLESLATQTHPDFHLILFNDGCKPKTLIKALRHYNRAFTIQDVHPNSPTEIRIEMMQYLYSSNWDIVVFGDTDDTFSTNRVLECVEAIESQGYQIVYNDLSLVNEIGFILNENIWKLKAEKLEIDLNFLLRQNVLGLGNTAIHKSILPPFVKADKTIEAFDWMFYLQIFYHNQAIKCKFIPDAITRYRQHNANMLGLKDVYSKTRLEKLYNIKLRILEFAIDIGISEATEHYQQLLKYNKSILQDKTQLGLEITRLNKNENSFFWFEEINTSDEKN